MVPAPAGATPAVLQGAARLLALYDFRVSPFTVGEMLYFQEATLCLREELGVDKIDLVWLCDSRMPARPDQGLTVENHHHHLAALLPLAHVNPHLGSFLLLDSLEAFLAFTAAARRPYYVFPPVKDVREGRMTYTDLFNGIVRFHAKHGRIPRISCRPATLLWARDFLARHVRPALPVVVHLRSLPWFPGRNAPADLWLDFLREGAGAGVGFVVIGTPEEIDPRVRELEHVVVAKDHHTTVEQDCALVQASAAYFGMCSGISMMAQFGTNPYAIYGYRPWHERVEAGAGHPFALPFQRIVWEAPTRERLRADFAEILGGLDAAAWGREFDAAAAGSGDRLRRWGGARRPPGAVEPEPEKGPLAAKVCEIGARLS